MIKILFICHAVTLILLADGYETNIIAVLESKDNKVKRIKVKEINEIKHVERRRKVFKTA